MIGGSNASHDIAASIIVEFYVRIFTIISISVSVSVAIDIFTNIALSLLLVLCRGRCLFFRSQMDRQQARQDRVFAAEHRNDGETLLTDERTSLLRKHKMELGWFTMIYLAVYVQFYMQHLCGCNHFSLKHTPFDAPFVRLFHLYPDFELLK